MAASTLPHYGPVDIQTAPDFHRQQEPLFQYTTAPRDANPTSSPTASPVSSVSSSLDNQIQSKQSTPSETLPLWLLFPGEIYYIVTIPRDSSGHPQCVFYDDSGTYKHIQVDLAQFSGGHLASFAAGLEVGRLSAVESLFMMDEAREGKITGAAGDEESGFLDFDEVPAQGALTLLKFMATSASDTISLPIRPDTPHYIIEMPQEPSDAALCFIYYLYGPYDDSKQNYKHVKTFPLDFTADDDPASFVAGVEVGRMSVLENRYTIDEDRIQYVRSLLVDVGEDWQVWDEFCANRYTSSEYGSLSDLDCEDEDHPSNDSVPEPFANIPDRYTISEYGSLSDLDCEDEDHIPRVKLPGMSSYVHIHRIKSPRMSGYAPTPQVILPEMSSAPQVNLPGRTRARTEL